MCYVYVLCFAVVATAALSAVAADVDDDDNNDLFGSDLRAQIFLGL